MCFKTHTTFVHKAVYRNPNNECLKGERAMSNYLSCNWEYTEIEENLDNLLHSNAVF